ncbi:MAG: MutS-related protein [Bacteroidota bacterium]
MNPSAEAFYQSKNQTYSDKLKAVSKKIKHFAWFRLFAFLLIFLPLIIWGWNGWLTVVPMFAFTVFFLFLIKKNIQLEKQKKKFEVLIKLTEDELLALKHRFDHFVKGSDFLDPNHFYAYDLDIFGADSLFQFINRTSTKSGRAKLAEWFKNPFLQKEDIEQRQEAIRELSQIPNWRLHFLANGHLFKETSELSNEIKNWAETDLQLNRPDGIKWLTFLLPFFTLLALIPAIAGISWIPFSMLVFTQWLLLYFSRKRVAQFYAFFGRKIQLLAKYIQLLEFVEDREFQAPYLLKLQKKVHQPHRASHIFRMLKKQVKQFEYRQNIILTLVFNSVFLWDIRCVYKLWKWHRQNRKKLVTWLGVIAEMDALISLSNFANNNPVFAYPKIHDGGFAFRAKQIGHPLLPPDKRVSNDLTIDGWSKVVIVTGANMAGKSTFLRTVGVNMVLARLGAPVCARELTCTPVKVYTNMRTTDSLLKDESYFFAELKRIKGVLDRLESGERILVILDEMLKGTNSVDKLNGSKELIRKLLHLKAVALIATHDLKLSEMEEEYPQQIFNKCFEITIKNDELVFDYLLSDGVTKTMNATFLMRKMGIT